jgi:tRNA threonylcarbamoyladenosine biosynthesis protein TsaB
MPSLRQVLATHPPLLLIDASSARVQAGWLEGGGAARWASAVAEAGVGVFRCLKELGADPARAGAFIHCEGPGSVLGVRIAAMALRAWRVGISRPVFAYRSLELVAVAEGRPGVGVIADARRGSWHHVTSTEPLRRVAAGSLSGPLIMPEGFRHWAPLPPGVEIVPYDLSSLFGRAWDADLLRETGDPDAFLHEEPSFAAWTPRIHSAPGAPGR